MRSKPNAGGEAAAGLELVPSDAALRRYCAVAGGSLLMQSARALRPGGPVGHFDYLALAALTEAVLLHDRVVVIAGDDLGVGLGLVTEVNDALGTDVIRVLAGGHSLEALIASRDVKHNVAELARAAFGKSAPYLSPALLNERLLPSRVADDYKRELLDGVVSIARTAEANAQKPGELFDELARFLLSQFNHALTNTDLRFVVFRLFRTLLLAAVASTQDGTLLAEGTRLPLAALLSYRLRRRAPSTLTSRLYSLANAAFQLATRPVLIESSKARVDLGLAYVVTLAPSREKFLEGLAAAARQFLPFRTRMRELQTTVLDPDTTLADRVSAHNEVLGAGASYLQQVIEELKLPRAGVRGWFDRSWLEMIDSIAPGGKYRVTGERSELAGEVTASASLAVLRGARRTWEHQKRVSQFVVLLEAVRAIATAKGIERRVREWFDIADFEPGVEAAFAYYRQQAAVGDGSAGG